MQALYQLHTPLACKLLTLKSSAILPVSLKVRAGSLRGPTWIRDLMLAKCVSMAPPWGKFWFILFMSSVKQLKARASGDRAGQRVSQTTASGTGAPKRQWKAQSRGHDHTRNRWAGRTQWRPCPWMLSNL